MRANFCYRSRPVLFKLKENVNLDVKSMVIFHHLAFADKVPCVISALTPPNFNFLCIFFIEIYLKFVPKIFFFVF